LNFDLFGPCLADEEIIAFAQQQENRAFEAQISTAEQIRERLLAFVSEGGFGADTAKAMFNQLTEELSRAGELLPTSIRRRQIRDPRTGRMVDVPSFYTPVSYDEYYSVLEKIYTIHKNKKSNYTNYKEFPLFLEDLIFKFL